MVFCLVSYLTIVSFKWKRKFLNSVQYLLHIFFSCTVYWIEGIEIRYKKWGNEIFFRYGYVEILIKIANLENIIYNSGNRFPHNSIKLNWSLQTFHMHIHTNFGSQQFKIFVYLIVDNALWRFSLKISHSFCHVSFVQIYRYVALFLLFKYVSVFQSQ